MTEIRFVVEQAGCDSCAALIRETLEPLGVVRSVDVDEAADEASVNVDAPTPLSQETVDELLGAVGASAGHEYRVRPGSWQAAEDAGRSSAAARSATPRSS